MTDKYRYQFLGTLAAFVAIIVFTLALVVPLTIAAHANSMQLTKRIQACAGHQECLDLVLNRVVGTNVNTAGN